MAWARTQSQMLWVRVYSQVTMLNQTTAANGSAGWLGQAYDDRIGGGVPGVGFGIVGKDAFERPADCQSNQDTTNGTTRIGIPWPRNCFSSGAGTSPAG